jgi:hypothetical protein
VIAIAIPSERWYELKIQGCLSAGKHNPQMFCLICSCEAQHGGLNAGQFEQAGGTKRTTTTKQESSLDIVLSATHNNLGSTIVESRTGQGITPVCQFMDERAVPNIGCCYVLLKTTRHS